MLLVFHCQNFTYNRGSSKALQSKAIDLSNASQCLGVCLIEVERFRHKFGALKTSANRLAEKWSINAEFSKSLQRKVTYDFAEICENKLLQKVESLIKVNIFYPVLDINIIQLISRYLGMNENVSNFSVTVTLRNLNDADLLGRVQNLLNCMK